MVTSVFGGTLLSAANDEGLHIHAARDLAQATFEVLFARHAEFRREASVATYLFRIARWKLVHHARTRRNSEARFEPLDPAILEDPGDQSMTSQLMESENCPVAVLVGE